MKPTQVLLVARPAEAEAWEPALRARGLEVTRAEGRKAAGAAARRVTPAVVLVSEKLPVMGALRVIRDLRQDPSCREAPMVLVGARPFTTSQRQRLGISAPDATVPRDARPDAVAEAALEAVRTGKYVAPELTPAQKAGVKYTRLANLLMMFGVIFAVSPSRGPHSFDPNWYIELVPLGGLLADIATGRVDGRARWLSWQGWAAIGFMAAIALALVFWPNAFRFGLG